MTIVLIHGLSARPAIQLQVRQRQPRARGGSAEPFRRATAGSPEVRKLEVGSRTRL